MIVSVLALSATPASAAPPTVELGAVSEVRGASAHVTGSVDPGDQYTFWSFETSTDGVTWSGFAFQGEIDGANDPGPRPVAVDLGGLQPETKYLVRLTATNFADPEANSASDEFTTLAVAAPKVLSVDDATGVDYTSVLVSGEVERPAGSDPALDTSCRFEYVTQAHFTAEGFTGAAESGCPDLITEAGAKAVVVELANLERGTKYHYRLTATNAGGSDTLVAANTFTTTTAPEVQTLWATVSSASAATMAARINPSNSPVAYQFEWGEVSAPGDSTYENVTASEGLPVIGEKFQYPTYALGGLKPATEYHYRVVAANTSTSEQAVGDDIVFTTRPASEPPPPSCPNESSRTGASAGLPECRAFEWATPGLNGSLVLAAGRTGATPDGSAIEMSLLDAPDEAESSEPLFIVGVARRGADGWSSRGLTPPTPEQALPNGGGVGVASADLSEWTLWSKQPLAGAGSPSGGSNLYLRRLDGTFVPLTVKGLGNIVPAAPGNASADLSRIFFQATKQIDADPIETGNTYEWENGQLRLLGILPNGNPAPQGAYIPPVYGTGRWLADDQGIQSTTSDGRRTLFRANGDLGRLYLRINAAKTVEVTKSHRGSGEDLNPMTNSCPFYAEPAFSECASGITPDGSKVIFASRSELTDDANTGETGGASTDAGADIYSYDVESGELTDLTANHDPANAATGAGVTQVVTTSADGSYVYFTAKGDLAPGGLAGEENLYVWHDGEIKFIAPATGVHQGLFQVGKGFYSTAARTSPDGRLLGFTSTEQLSAYDNESPLTGDHQPEVYRYTYGGSVECISCRPNGEPPIGLIDATTRPFGIVNDGRVFFHSNDEVIPQASNGRTNVYEYLNGGIHLLSPGSGEDNAFLFDISESGDDVFIYTHDELGPEPTGHASAVYDARVNANTFRSPAPECQGENCRGAGTSAPNVASAGSATFAAPGSISAVGPKAVKQGKVQVRVAVPAGGELKASGVGLKTVEKTLPKAGSASVTLVLKPAAERTRRNRGVFRTTAQMVFSANGGEVLRANVPLMFEAVPKKRGGK
ncbi:MAG TPA: hypothetical protein VGO36_05680 [Solirubrobacterales bacterium]|nr:hypothetical protein [Solirubrobacterales bacterium]